MRGAHACSRSLALPPLPLQEVYPIVDRVREKKLLTRTAESGLLSALQEQGITLSQAEKLLPLLEQTGALSFLAKNGEFLLNTVGFLVRG
jgi:hypothetical protein